MPGEMPAARLMTVHVVIYDGDDGQLTEVGAEPGPEPVPRPGEVIKTQDPQQCVHGSPGTENAR
jgi:hypothetical protein